MAATVVLAPFGAFMLLGVAQLGCLLVQHRIGGFLDGLPDDSLQIVLEAFFVDFDYIVVHRMVLFRLICDYFKSKNRNILFFLPP